MLVTPAGARLWRFRYRYQGRENMLGLGPYPEITLQEARTRREDARRKLKLGVDLSAERKAAKAAAADNAANSFEVVAREWHGMNQDAWAPTHAERILRRFERDVFPWIGVIPIARVSPPELLAVLRRIESRGRIETAHRALSNCGQVFRYAVATGRAERDPAAASAARWPRQRASTLPRLQTRRASARCSRRSTATRRRRSFEPPCGWHRWCSRAPAN